MAFCFDAHMLQSRKVCDSGTGLTVESAMDIYFEIEADDPRRAIDFYSQVFGWRFSQDEGPDPYWRIGEDGSDGGLLPRTATRPPAQCGATAFVCSIEVENFDATEQTIRRLGGLVKEPKFPVPGQS
jgi:uncharacterized protein